MTGKSTWDILWIDFYGKTEGEKQFGEVKEWKFNKSKELLSCVYPLTCVYLEIKIQPFVFYILPNFLILFFRGSHLLNSSIASSSCLTWAFKTIWRPKIFGLFVLFCLFRDHTQQWSGVGFSNILGTLWYCTSGSVLAVLGDHMSPGSIWGSYEMPSHWSNESQVSYLLYYHSGLWSFYFLLDTNNFSLVPYSSRKYGI